MKTLRLTFAIAIAATLTGGCTRNFYTSYPQPVTLFTQQGEFQITVAHSDEFSSTAESKEMQVMGFDGVYTTQRRYVYANSGSNTAMQGAYAITNHLALAAGLSFYRKGVDAPDNDYDGINYGEAAVGYYRPLSNIFTAEVYGGAGLSSQHHVFTDLGHADAKSVKCFVQPNIGLSIPVIDVALSSRLSCINYFGIDNQVSPTGLHWAAEDHASVEFLRNHTFLLIEPAFTIRTGWKWLKVHYQFAAVWQLNNTNLILHGLDEFSHRHYIGLTYTFGRRFE